MTRPSANLRWALVLGLFSLLPRAAAAQPPSPSPRPSPSPLSFQRTLGMATTAFTAVTRVPRYQPPAPALTAGVHCRGTDSLTGAPLSTIEMVVSGTAATVYVNNYFSGHPAAAQLAA